MDGGEIKRKKAREAKNKIIEDEKERKREQKEDWFRNEKTRKFIK